MAAKAIKHTVEGAVGERKSPRVYTHAIIGKSDFARLIVKAKAEKGVGMKRDWDYRVRCANGKVGDEVEPGKNRDWFKIDQGMIDSAKEYFAMYGHDMAVAAQMLLDERLAAIEADRVRAGDKFYVLQWSMSESAAHKAVSTWTGRMYFTDVSVVPVVRHG